ncbi:non-ribosomal peptide synthetase [Pseudoduganella chitinolytica]|uniref:Amino acid adenylation domain-containing protein n=1 Tax=Pseudoduganella chitinolytica TaxID=34070 RepID=A0ABY8BAG9_9BURK|nr:non-ribosomal peptide synthetase [Pseudoduganella chitinolytica]WEF32912.1 amino acid adenylation domain-containing protein [Pseudoduganella chitinolytica]
MTLSGNTVHTNDAVQDQEICAAAATTLHQAVLDSAATRAGRIAVVDSATGLEHGYDALARDTARLAQAIWCAVSPPVSAAHTGHLIAVLCEKGYHQALATLAVMQAAHAYLPLHVDWPAARLLDVMAEGGVEYVLVSRQCAADEALCAALSARHRLLVIEELLEAPPLAATLPTVQPDDIAYVIFTSGSTGKPKGVTISHRGALNTIAAVNRDYAVGPEDRILALSELSFDLSVYDIFGLLMAGGTVVFPDQRRTREAPYWAELVARHGITIWDTVPQLAGLLADDYATRGMQGDSLRLFLLSGDKIPLALPGHLKQACPNAMVVSLGGATEGSIWSIWFPIDAVAPHWRAIPYGRAMPNQLVLVLDEDGMPCAPGVSGEIHIGGAGVALNYWGDEVRTAASFLFHPQFGRLYRTGDLGALNEAGYLEFIGRKDRQVKIRGYRVELGEIEARLAACAGVRDCAVVDLHALQGGQGRQQLLAYYVADGLADGHGAAALRAQLRAQLPDYMVPEHYTAIAKLPLTANGKVDYKALPLPGKAAARALVLPASALERDVAAIWADVLGLPADALGTGDDFVTLGGDSIDAIRLASRLRQALQCSVTVADIFEGRTIQALCRLVQARGNGQGTAVATESGLLVGAARLLPVQQWFFQQQFDQPGQWSQAFVIRTPRLDPARLQACIDRLFAHHDAFRLRFIDGARQHYADAAAPILAIHDDGAMPDLEQRLRQAQEGFDLAQGPLCHVEYVTGCADGSARVCFLVHHLLVDTVSWRILAEDLERLYHGGELEPKGSSYRQWAEALQAYAAANPAQAGYWQAQLAAHRDPFAALDLPGSDTPVCVEFSLHHAATAHLLQEANHVHHTEINDLLLAALSTALAERFGNRANVIMLEGHGREEIDPAIDISRTMGWFTSLFPLELRAGADVADTIRTVKEALRAIPDKGVGFGALLGYAGHALPAICFNYLGQLEKQAAGGDDWALTDDSLVLLSGERNRDGYRLVITGAVLDGQMRFTVESRAGAELAAGVADALRAALAEIVGYTGSQARSYLTPHDVSHVVTQAQLDQLQAEAEVQHVYLANSLQQGFIYHAQAQGDTDTAYQVQTMWEYHSAIDEEKLRLAWHTAQRMYGALRMRMAWQDKLLQVIDRDAPLAWHSLDFSDSDAATQRKRLDALLDEDRQRRFALDQSGMFRLYFVRLGAAQSALLFSCHHAILDGWSSLVLINRTHDIYLDLLHGREHAWPENRAYQLAQRHVQASSGEHADYWRAMLEDAPVQNRLSALIKPGLKEAVDLKTYKYVSTPAMLHHWYRGEQVDALRTLCLQQGVTVNALFEFLCHQILNLYSYEPLTITGATVSGRDLPLDGMEDAVGMMINTLPLLTRHAEIANLEVGAALRELQRQITGVNSKSATYLASLQKDGRRIFDLLFVHNNFATLQAGSHVDALRIDNLRTIEKLDYPLAMIVEENGSDGGSEIQVTIRYAGELFDDALIQGFFGVMDRLLAQVVARPETLVRELDCGAAAPAAPAAVPQTSIVAEFERCAAVHPDRIALQHGALALDYAELNRRANVLAAHLQARFAPRMEAMVPVCFSDPVLDIVASLAVLKLGGAYVPLAASTSPALATFTIGDTAAPFLLTESTLAAQFTAHFASADAVVVLDTLALDGDAPNPGVPVTPANLCCVMYTSGSTGRPKGVLIEHRGVTSLVRDAGFIDITADDVFAHLADRRFDASLFEVWGALLNGAKLVLASDPLALFGDVNALATLLREQAVSVLWLTKSVFDELYRQSERLFASLTWLLVGGEALNRQLVEKLLASDAAPKHLLNGYGPTENTTFSTVCDLTLDKLAHSRAVPIGRPLRQRQALVLGRAMQRLPAGAIGELYVGGAGLARGYLNNPELTAAAFVEGDQRLYKTGDLVMLSPQGELVFMGRADAQVKLRGYRIELEELELAMLGFASVERAAAAIKTGANGHKQLVGYYLSSGSVDAVALRDYLVQVCPDFMVPSLLVPLTTMPLTASGKVNREMLPDPAAAVAVAAEARAPGMTELQLGVRRIWADVLGLREEQMDLDADFFALGGDSILCLQMVGMLNKQYRKNVSVRIVFKNKTLAALAAFIDNAVPAGYNTIRKIWSEVLGVPATGIGYHDDFFAIGGDSILCLQMVNKVSKELKQKVPARIVFKNKTIALLHAWVEQAERAAEAKAAPVAATATAELVPLHPIQCWFFALQPARPNHWNQSFLIHTPALDLARLGTALRALVAAHGAFALRYRRTAAGPEQFHAGAPETIALPAIDVAGMADDAIAERLTSLQAGFDIEQGPLFAAAYLHGYADGSARVFMAFHHLIVDAVSWRILLGDLEMLYAGETLPAASASIGDWSRAVAAYGTRNAAERSYWQKVLADYDATAYRALATVPQGGRTAFRLDAGLTSALLHQSHHAFNTSINDLLVAALGLALRDLRAQDVHHIVIEGHGREHLDDAIDIGRTVGWFTILCPLRVTTGATLADTVKATKETLRAVPLKGLGYGALFGYDRNALPAVSFNYLGQFHEARDAGWYLADEPSGRNFHQENVNGNLVDINCYVKAGQLVVDIDSQLAPDLAQRFTAQLQARIAEVVGFCQARRTTEYSASDFAAIGSAADLDQLPAIDSGDPYDWFEMTEIQKAYLLGRLASFEIGNIANHIYYEYAFDALDPVRLESALNTLIAREDVLRTVFSFDRMQQRIVPLEQFGHYRVACNDHADRMADDGALAAVRERLSHRVYDPEHAPLFTFEVSRFADRSCLHISMDLILLDAESRRRLLARLDQLYRQPDLPAAPPVTTFKHYQAAYQALRKSPWYQRDRAYWQALVPAMPLRPELPLRMAPSAVTDPVFADHTLYVEPGTWRKFKAQAAKYDVSPSAVLLSLYGEVIGFHAGSSEFIMTMTVFNRYPMFDDVERIMGDFTSTNLFHFKSHGADVLETVQRSHRVMWDNIAHSLYTGLEVQRDLVRLHDLDMHKATSPIVFTGVLGNKNGAHENSTFLTDGERSDQRLWMGQTSQAWIDLQAIETGERFMSKWLYVDQLFERATIARMNADYCAMITWLAEHDWTDAAGALPAICARQRELIARTNHVPQEVPRRALFDLIEPSDAPAVIDAVHGTTTYRALLEQSGRLARHLWRQAGAGGTGHTGKLAAILCEKGAGQVVAALAAMQAGHGYLPLNVGWPLARLLAVLAEGKVEHLLVSRAQMADATLAAALAGVCQPIVIEDVLDAADEEPCALPRIEADDVAYVIFTSGSTGTPKGVTISHHGALNTIVAVNRQFAVSPRDKVLALSELSFDLSVYDIFGLLIAGGTVVFPEQARAKDMAAWVELVEQHQVTLWNTVPQLAGLLAEEYRLQRRCNSSLRAFLLSGDRIPLHLPMQLRERCNAATVTSLGGATEGSIWSIWHPVDAIDPAWQSIPYGTAMPNQSMLVLNDHGQACPFGVTGEIHIGGQGVALNYWGDAARTAASFIAHPTEGRLYKTGDLGRYLADGSIEFIGRKDGQVKIRGYRVELGEIEACLGQLAGVEESVLTVSPEQSGGRQLTAYVKPARRLRVADEQIAFKLAQHGDRVVDDGAAAVTLAPDTTGWKQRSRKSYRMFQGAPLAQARLLAALTAQPADASPTAATFDTLATSLHGLLAQSDAGAPLPKYRYPSAGTLYPVQVYLRVHGELDGLAAGNYYLDRRQHRLVRLGDVAAVSAAAPVELLLVGTPAAIEPVYGKDGAMLSLLECGYIEGVLNADEQPLRWQRGTVDDVSGAGLALQEGQAVLGRLIPAQAQVAMPRCFMHVRPGQVQDLAPGWYSLHGTGLTAQPWQPLHDPQGLDDNAMVWHGSALAVFFVSAHASPAEQEYVDAGAATQQLMERLLDANIGTCAIGEVHPEQRATLAALFGGRAVTHHFVAGAIGAEQKQASGGSELDRAACFAQHVERQLQQRLPHYMVPERFVFLDALPLSANGKVDRAALLAHDAAATGERKPRQLPTSAVEITLARLWSEMLDIDQHTISVEDHFFRLGGNSLLAMQFISRVNQEFACQLKLDELYQFSDLKSISIRLEAANANSVDRASGEL